ncbi:MAG: hypothetical protein AAF502_19915 [Bacteroidota bacterium]
MPSVKYAILVEVNILHNYYLADAGSPLDLPAGYSVQNDLVIVPSPMTVTTLKNYRLLFRRTPTGLVILARMNGNETEIPMLIDRNIKMEFAVNLANPYFMNFSDLPMSAGVDRSYRFTNTHNNSNAGLNLLSDPGASPYVGQADEEFLADTSEYYLKAPFGLITLEHSTNVPSGNRFIDNTNDGEGNPQSILVPQKYYIRFRNRSTHWRYYFSEEMKFPAAQTFAGFDVEDKTVDGAEQIIHQVATTNAIALKETFQVLDGSVFNLGNLPNPTISHFKPDPVDNTKFYSETFL